MNTALIVAQIGFPTLMVLVGILLNRSDANRLDARITALEASLRGEMSASQASVRSEINGLRVDIAGARKQFHDDVVMLLNHDKEQDTRITRLENRN